MNFRKIFLCFLILSLLISCKTLVSNKSTQNKKPVSSKQNTVNSSKYASSNKTTKGYKKPFTPFKSVNLKKYLPKISINTHFMDNFLKNSKEISLDANQGIKKISFQIKKSINNFFGKTAAFFKKQGKKFSNLKFVKWWNSLFEKKTVYTTPSKISKQAKPAKTFKVIKPAKTTVKKK